MEAATAAWWINENVHLMPGYRVRAQANHPSRDPNWVVLQYQIDTLDTDDYWYAPKRITVNPTVDADVSTCKNGADLSRVVLDNLMFILSHEHREGLRVGKEMLAPFHPHRTDGQRRYSQTAHLAKQAPIAA